MLFFLNPLRRGLKLIEQKNFGEAFNLFSGLVDKKLHLADSHFYLAVCAFELGDFARAKISLHAALDLKPEAGRVAEILELTNWNMISSGDFYNTNHAFSPDGGRIAFVCSKQDSNNDGKINMLDNTGIYVHDLAAGTEECVVPPEHINTRLCFSPDGKSIAYISNRPRGQEGATRPALWLLDLETRVERELLKDFNIKYHLFSPDGGKIYFSGWKEGDKNSGIYSFDFETGAVHNIVPAVYESTFPSVSPGGDKLLYASWRRDTNGDGIIDFHDNSGIYLKNLATGLEEELVSPDCNNTFPVFSNDGKRILYLSVRRDTNGDGLMDSLDNAGIYLHDLESGREKCLIDDTFYNKFPVFSAEGKKIIFVTSGCHFRITCTHNDFFGYKGIYMLDLEKKEFIQVMSGKFYGSRAPVAAPRGTKIAYTSWRKGTNRGLYVADSAKLPEKSTLHEWIDKNL